MARRNARESMKKKRNKKLWSPESEEMLMDLWQDMAGALRSDRLKCEIHKEMASKLNMAGYNLTCIDVRTKLNNWKRKYRSESITSTWTFYERIHSILGEYSFDDMDDEDMSDSSTKNETSISEPKSGDTSSCDNPKDFIKEPEYVAVNLVGFSNHIDNDAATNRRESLDDMVNSKHVAATNYIRSLLCQLPYNVAQNLSFDIISMCHEEIKKHRNYV